MQLNPFQKQSSAYFSHLSVSDLSLDCDLEIFLFTFQKLSLEHNFVQANMLDRYFCMMYYFTNGISISQKKTTSGSDHIGAFASSKFLFKRMR